MSRLAIFAILIASIAAVPGNVLPVTLGLLTGKHGLDAAMLGYLVAANTFAGLLTSLSAPFWIRRVGLRPAITVLLVLNAAALVGLGQAPGLPWLFVMQLLLGIAGVGIASICVMVIAQLDNPGRAYGLKITSDVIIAGSFLSLLPVATLGLERYAIVLAVPFLLTILLVPRLPATGFAAGAAGSPTVALSAAPRSAWLVLVTMVVFYIAGTGMWPFIERLGVHAGLDQNTAANMIAAGLFVGMTGSLGAVLVAGRFRAIWPQTFGGVLFALSIPALALAEGPVAFAAAVFVFNAAWNFFIPFVVALVAASDTTRRLGALVPGTAMLGGIVGPPLNGNLITIAGFEVATLVMMSICMISIVGYVVLARARLR